METKTYIYLGIFIGSTIGSWLGSLLGGGFLSAWSIILGTIGSLLGIGVGYKLGEG